jgi:hypothetical protein
MNLKFCDTHEQELHRALTRRGLSEIGWRNESERKEAASEQVSGHVSQRNFNPFIQSWIAICVAAGDKFGEKAEGCPVCMLGVGSTIIEQVANQMTQFVKNLPAE